MTLAAGVDLGTGAVKAALFDVSHGEARWLSRNMSRIRQRDPLVLARQAYDSMLEELDLDADLIDYTATTGDGENIPFRTGHFYSMTTHARGATYLCPGINAVVDIGALHGRAIAVDERGKVLTYKMTSQCASGSGQFLENIARYLGVTLEEVGSISKTADNPETVSSICAVLAETDVINMISRGITTANILKGIHIAMASRLVKLLKSIKARDGSVLLTGGLAADEGLVEAMEEQVLEQKLKVRILTHPDSIYAGAIGAALWGAFRHDKLLQPKHGAPSPAIEASDPGTPVLAVGLGEEEVVCPMANVLEPGIACPAERKLEFGDRDKKLMKPTDMLMQEHRLIEQVLDCLEDAAGRLEDGEDVDPDFFIDAAEFVTGFADGCHHRKEEEILFVAMTARDMPQDAGPVAVMLHEHEEGRRFTAAFRSAADQIKRGDDGAAADLIRNVFDYVNLLREHIVKEDNMLFPMAEQVIPDNDMQHVSEQFERITVQDEQSGLLAKHQALAAKLCGNSAAVSGNRISA